MSPRHPAIPRDETRPLADAWFLTGPTAAGKTDVGLELAERLGAEIVSLDSMALYRRLDIGTAKPTANQRRQVAHHLIDLIEPAEEFSLARYLAAAEVAAGEIRARGRQPLFVGGTPLYLKALLRGMFHGPAADWELRRRLEASVAIHGNHWLHQRVRQVDPVSARRLHPNDTRRLIRAYEVYQRTGQPISRLQQQFDRARPPEACRVYVLDWPRDELVARIDARVEAMFAAGLVAEVERLVAEGRRFSRTARQALGYREVLEHLEGLRDLNDTVALVQLRTRRFAKRQMTWFRSLSECRMLGVRGEFNPAEVARRIVSSSSPPELAQAADDRRPAVDERAWQAGTLDDRAAWHHALPREFIEQLRACISGLARESCDATKLQIDDRDRADWDRHLAPARRALETGRGFVIVERLPLDCLSQHEPAALYWLVGRLLGEPLEQNVEGTLLYDVRDTGRDVADGARFSVTNYESSFHTDSSFGQTVVDYVGLLCLRTAKLGGLSQIVSGYSAHDVLARENPEVLNVLHQEFHVDRRGGFREGESPTVRRPVFARHPTGLLIRYLRYWIEAGHERIGQPLTAGQRQALDVLDGVLQRAELRAELALEPGQMLFINNRWILHNRTAFTDHPEPQRRRHLVRLWLRARSES